MASQTRRVQLPAQTVAQKDPRQSSLIILDRQRQHLTQPPDLHCYTRRCMRIPSPWWMAAASSSSAAAPLGLLRFPLVSDFREAN